MPDDTLNDMRPLELMISQANNDVSCHHQAMKTDDADSFREAMCKEIQSFKDEGMFELTLAHKKPIHKLLIPFVWSSIGNTIL